MPERATALSVNLNKVALLRNARDLDVPSVDQAAHVALAAGADGLTVHPRPDGRHIRVHDVEAVARIVARYPGCEFNIEGNPLTGAEAAGARPDYPGFLRLVASVAEHLRVHQVTLVPDEPGQSTSDHGWDLPAASRTLRDVIPPLQALGCRVSLFVDPAPGVMAHAAETGADRVELYTEPYARAVEGGEGDRALDLYAEAAVAAMDAGLEVNAGHDLNLSNLGPFVRHVPGVREVSIGHALTADALWMGLGEAVRAYLHVLEESRASGRAEPVP